MSPVGKFDPRFSHVIPALIRKCLEAKKEGKKSIEVWGTGNGSREFLYVSDAAEAILLATEHYNKSEPVNLGVGKGIYIRDSVTLIARYTGYEGNFRWDTSKPDGQVRHGLDSTRAKKEFGFEAKTDFEEGLKRTTAWYEARLRN